MGDLSTPDSVQKLQTALHAKAKAEPGYRFYALYDKISREDILAHAYARCRSNKGAPGVDRQDFEAVEAYGVERWLGELALALRQETYRPDAIRRVFIPKANGKLRPLGTQPCGSGRRPRVVRRKDRQTDGAARCRNPLHAYSRKAPCAARGRSATRDVRRAKTLPLKRLPRRLEIGRQ